MRFSSWTTRKGGMKQRATCLDCGAVKEVENVDRPEGKRQMEAFIESHEKPASRVLS